MLPERMRRSKSQKLWMSVSVKRQLHTSTSTKGGMQRADVQPSISHPRMHMRHSASSTTVLPPPGTPAPCYHRLRPRRHTLIRHVKLRDRTGPVLSPELVGQPSPCRCATLGASNSWCPAIGVITPLCAGVRQKADTGGIRGLLDRAVSTKDQVCDGVYGLSHTGPQSCYNRPVLPLRGCGASGALWRGCHLGSGSPTIRV